MPIENTTQLFIIIYALFALFGAQIVFFICVAYLSRHKMNNHLLRARVFLSDSFLRDSWALLLMLSTLLFVDTIMELNNITGLFIEVDLSESISEITRIGIIGCALISTHRWYKLINPTKNFK